MSIINFWISAYRLPKGCIREIDKLCSAFLWSGPDLNPRKAKVAWDAVCKTKKEGGLGVRSVYEANKVCVLKLIWRMLTGDSLWSRWIKDTILKDKSFWEVKETSTKGSWIWKKMLKYRPIAQDFVKVQVGNGLKISFWHDRWSSMGVLFKLLGPRGIIDTGLPLHATLSMAIMRRRNRRYRDARLIQLEVELENLRNRPQNERERDDLTLWKAREETYKHGFSTKGTWDMLRIPGAVCHWYRGIWFNHATPKYVFVTWLALLNRLSTGDRSKAWNGSTSSSCFLCNGHEESRNHLFFGCDFSARIWRDLAKGLMGVSFTSAWEEVVDFISQDSNRILISLIRYAFQLSVHSVWNERNRRKHGEKPRKVRQLSRMLDKMVRNWISMVKSLGQKEYEDALLVWFSTRE